MQLDVQIADVYQQKVKRVNLLMSVQNVVGSNIAVEMLLMINLCLINNIIIINNSIGSLTIHDDSMCCYPIYFLNNKLLDNNILIHLI